MFVFVVCRRLEEENYYKSRRNSVTRCMCCNGHRCATINLLHRRECFWRKGSEYTHVSCIKCASIPNCCITLIFLFCFCRRYNVYLRVKTIMKKSARKTVKMDVVFLPKKKRRVLNKRLQPPKRVRDENVIPVSKLLDSQTSITSLCFDSQAFDDSGVEDGATQCSMPSLPFTPSQPKKRQRLPSTQSPKMRHLPPLSPCLSPLSPLATSLPLTQLSPGSSLPLTQLSPGPSLPLTQLSPGHSLSLTQLSPGRSPLLRRPMLTMAQTIIRNVDEAMKHTSTCTNAQLTRALARAATSAQQLRDAILAADL